MSEDEGKKVTAYRLEYASSGRAKCKGPKPCAGSVINKGDLRLGTPVTFAGRTSMAWRHWGCVTQKIIGNFKSSFSSVEELDGYEELKKADKERVLAAWEQGHVADEDIPDTAKKGAVDEEDEGEKKTDSKKKSKAKKAKKDDNDEDEAEAPKKKAPKKASTAKEKAPPKKKPSKKKKASDSEGENFEEEIDKISDEEDEPEDEEIDSGKKRKRPAPKKEAETKKSKKPRAKKPKKKTESEDEDEEV